MTKYNLGILGTADIAYRRFLPALAKNETINYVGVASRSIDKTNKFIQTFGGVGYSSYDELINDDNIDIVYIPLPPALHYEWGKKALFAGKHVFMEKPFCTEFSDAKELCEIARARKLIVYENYMFLKHKQLNVIKDLLNNETIGKIRLIRIAFGFPKRDVNDFRYNKDLGGGALLDCGVYTVKLANELIGNTMKLNYVSLTKEKADVDIYGNAAFENDNHLVAQVSFGMDNSYKCELEIWGSSGSIKAPRIFTAPSDYEVNLQLEKDGKIENIYVGTDDQFFNSINHFEGCLNDLSLGYNEQNMIMEQSKTISLMLGV